MRVTGTSAGIARDPGAGHGYGIASETVRRCELTKGLRCVSASQYGEAYLPPSACP